jgi:hypothetical protein
MALLTGIAQGPDAGILDVIAGLAAAAGGGDSFFMTGKDVLLVNNGSGGTITVTLVAVADNFGVTNAAHNLTFAILAGKLCAIGPLTLARFKDANGLCQITYSGVTSLTVGVLRVGSTA